MKAHFANITARGKEPKRIYFTKTDYEKFKEYIEDAQEKYGCFLDTQVRPYAVHLW